MSDLKRFVVWLICIGGLVLCAFLLSRTVCIHEPQVQRTAVWTGLFCMLYYLLYTRLLKRRNPVLERLNRLVVFGMAATFVVYFAGWLG